jgi:hypothetical protein
MKNKLMTLAAATLMVASVACTAEKTGEGTYKVETPTASETAAATAEASQDAAEAAQDAKEAGRDAANATGTAMETAGKEIQEHAKPGDQK